MTHRQQVTLVFFCVFILTWSLLLPHLYEWHSLSLAGQRYFLPVSEPLDTPYDTRYRVFAAELDISPRFSLSAVDLQEFGVAIDRLKENAEFFASYYEDPAEQMVVRELLYPIDYLRTLKELEEDRRAVISEPTKEHSFEYLKTLEAVVEAYDQHLERLPDFYDTFPKRVSGLIDGATNVNDIMQWFTALQTDARKTHDWIEVRKRCLYFYEPTCMVSYPEVISRDHTLPEDPHIDDNDLAVLKHLAEVESDEWRESKNDTLRFAPLLLYNARCSMYGKAEQALLWWKQTDNEPFPYMRFSHPDELLFFDHRPYDNSYSMLFVDHDIEYQYQFVNHYLCWQYGYDLTELATTYDIFDRLRADTIFDKRRQFDARYAELAELEEQIRTSTSTLPVALVVRYVTGSRDYLSDQPLTLNGEEVQKLQQLLLRYADKSSYLPDALMHIYHVNSSTRKQFRLTETMPIEEFIYIQSAHSLTLLPFNQTAVTYIDPPVHPYGKQHGYGRYLKQIQSADDYFEDMIATIDDIFLETRAMYHSLLSSD